MHAIDLLTNQRERIASVPFVPTCLGAGHGWICIGGYNKGQCTFIDLRDAPPFGRSIRSTPSAEVDELLPLDLDPHARLLAQRRSRPERATPRRRPKIITKGIGDLIVNAITIYKYVHKSIDVPDETVAILSYDMLKTHHLPIANYTSNNDRFVTVWSLSQQTTLNTLPFPIPMNHASISPDGRLLVSVGDEGRAFFHHRIPVQKPKSNYQAYDWQEVESVRLSGPVTNDSCFTTAFSPSGHVCAVATQSGTITLFDVRRIRKDMEDDEAVIDILKGSRLCFSSSSLTFAPGAPRSMAFSPEPWDLLVWAEDHGKFCVTDLRDGFRSRQTVDLNLDDEAVTRVELGDLDAPLSAEQMDIEREARFVRRHQDALDAQDHLAAVQSAADYMENAAERRRRQLQLVNSRVSLDEPSLDDAEQEILETLRIERENADTPASHNNNSRPFSVNYSGNSPASNSPSSSIPISFGQYVANRGNTRNTPGMWNYPRRRGSVVISNSNAPNASSSHPSSLTPGGPAPLSTSPARLTPTSAAESQRSSAARDTSSPPLVNPSSSTADPWQTISAAMASATTSQVNNSNAYTPSHNLPEFYFPHMSERRPDDPSRLSSLYAHSLLQSVRETSRRARGDGSSLEFSRETLDELNRHRIREREREREAALRRERLRALHAANNEVEADEIPSRSERLQRLRSARFRQLRERAGMSSDTLSMGEEDLAFLQELSTLVDQNLAERDPSTRVNGEVGVQGVGWSRDGRHL